MGVSIQDIDKGMNRIVKEIEELGKYEIAIGIFNGSGNARDNLAERAAVHEFGVHSSRNKNKYENTKRIPRRSFMRPTFDDKKNYFNREIDKSLDKLIEGKADAKKILKSTGIMIEKEVKDKINNGNFQRLALSTIIKKGSSKPLIDSGSMINAITFNVRTKKDD